MIFWFFGGKIVFFCKNTITIVNAFIVFIKFLSWIVVDWVRLVKLIEEEGSPRFCMKGPNYKNKKYNKEKKYSPDQGARAPLDPPWVYPCFRYIIFYYEISSKHFSL